MSTSLPRRLDPHRRRAIQNIRDAAERIWSRPLHRYYTDHSVEHSERVIALLDGLTEGMMETDKRLCPTEVYVLLAAAYLHDIGMQNERYAEGDLEEIRAIHHELAAEMIYAVFEDPANAFPIPLQDDPSLIEAIALASKGHRTVDLSAAEYDDLVIGGERVRLRLLGALIRFADALDIDYRRVDLELMQKLMNVPIPSQVHWWRCYYVSGVRIEDEFIRIAYRLPRSRPDYEGLIVPLVENGVREELAALREIFRANAVKVDIGDSQVRPMRGVDVLPAEVEELARQVAGGSDATANATRPAAMETTPSRPKRTAKRRRPLMREADKGQGHE